VNEETATSFQSLVEANERP